MHKTVKWIIGGGLATTFVVAAGLAVAVEKHERHHDKSNAENWHMGKGHNGRHHMRFGRTEMTLETLQTSLTKRFSSLDADGNGLISPDEFSAKAIERFMTIDADGNGTLTRAEIKEAHKSRHKSLKEQRKGDEDKSEATS